MTSAHPTAPVMAGAAYWRRNPFLAASMEAIVVTLVDGRFTAVGRDGTPVWDGPVTGVSGSLAKTGTFKLTVDGRKFAVVGRGSLGGMEKDHSPAQRQYLTGFLQSHPNTLAPDLKAWRATLAAAGARVS